MSNKKSYLERVKELIEKEPEGLLTQRLNEKGVECSLVVPLFEYLLGFNSLTDIQYEITSKERNGQRFDFIINDEFIVEAKSLGVSLEKNIEEQLLSYLNYNEKYDFGFLTNGWEYRFFITKRYIERTINEGKPLGENIDKSIRAFVVQVNDDHFVEVMELFSKELYQKNIKNIATYIQRIYEPTKGPATKLHDNKDIDSYIKRLIENSVDIRRGFYYDRVRTGEIKAGDKMSYKSKDLEITVYVEKDGTIILPKDGIKINNMSKILEDGKFPELLTNFASTWSRQDTFFDSPYEIILQMMGRRNKFKGIEQQYPFN